ncbi:hypothetical protein [Archangium primigenium]|uniref:hypothetical protein n=1 Tax=[Archangium] primigenium TaxID=2792470 RepID=UPI00195B17B1|nr:hypothetical protein [Archangium primigenium]MBM7113938.1 hypothetical protein [Archangium primigenium]
MDPKTEKTCDDFYLYHQTLLSPAAQEFESNLSAGRVRLHHVVQVNMLTAHAVDYLVAIRNSTRGSQVKRSQLVREFDKDFFVLGARVQNQKFQIVDAVNNSVKHIELDRGRYKELVTKYGDIGFRCLREEGGLVLFETTKYRFDYSRVVLGPVLSSIARVCFDGIEAVYGFAQGGGELIQGDASDEDPIDRMIAYCNPVYKCDDCGQSEDDCRCGEFVYDGERGEFRPFKENSDFNFDFDDVMAEISGAYTKD